MNQIRTERLSLTLVPMAGLAATAALNRAASRKLISATLPDAWFDEAWVFEMRLKQWTEDPAYAPWSIRSVALTGSAEVIGSMNCHHRPMPFIIDGQTIVAVEMGYTIFAPWQRQGYGYEMVTGFMRWARTRAVEALVLSISPENTPSLALAAKLGARRIGSHVDEEDGPEDIFLARFA